MSSTHQWAMRDMRAAMRTAKEAQEGMNKIIIIGNLTRDPEVKYTAKGTAIAKFTVAVARRFKDQDGKEATDFFDVDAWGKLGELAGQYLAKGRKVAVEGDMRMEKWEDRDGNKRTSWKVHANEIEFLTPRDKQGGGGRRQDDDIQFNEVDDRSIEDELASNQPYGF